MQIVPLAARSPVTEFASHAASSAEVAHGGGTSHVHVVAFEPGGVIGRHPAGFAQVFVPIRGSGWIAGADGARHPITVGECAFVSRQEQHSKGSDVGMTALVVQVTSLEPGPTPPVG